MRFLPSLVCCFLIGVLPRVGGAQEALVLSGGGARGLAHAGVLEGLEERGYDPDIVVGTSIGALVGALYAAGYEPGEIRERILGIDWTELFTPTPVVEGPDRTARYPMLSLDLEVARLRFARGLVGQWRVNRALATLLFDANARARGDFDRLARRYRAVATDLQTGEAVVIGEGDLARAARASMAVPAAFAPLAWGERILIDGGIANNLPTDVARDLGARRVIAVDVSRPPEEIHSLRPLAVLGRAMDLFQENAQRDSVPPDVLILPEIDPDITIASFPADPTPLFDVGREAARGGLSPSPPEVGGGERPLPSRPDSLHALLIEAADSSHAALARRAFDGVVPERYDPAAVLQSMDRLYSTGLFEAVWPRVIENPDTGRAGPVLLVRLTAPPQVSLSAAAGYENDRGARAWASLDRHSRLGRLPVTMSASVSTNGLERTGSVYLRGYPLNRPALAWTLGAHLREHEVRLYQDDALRFRDVLRAGGWVGLEFPHSLRDRVAVIGVRSEWIREDEGRRGVSTGPFLRFTYLNPETLVVGVPLLLEAERRWGAVSYSRAALRGSRRTNLGPLLLAGVADVQLTSDGTPADVVPALGDTHAIPGLEWGEERGRTRTVVGADAAYPLLGVFARLRLRAGVASDEVSGWGSGRWITGAQLGAVWRNPVATVEWGFGANTRGDRRFDISLGRHF